MCVLSRVQLFVTLWAVGHQAPLSMEFSRQEYWSVLPFPTPGDLSDPGIEPGYLCILHWQVGSLPLCHLGSPKACTQCGAQTHNPEIKSLIYVKIIIMRNVPGRYFWCTFLQMKTLGF